MRTLLINDAPARPIQPMTEDEFFAFCQLGWLIEPKRRRVSIYRPNREPELLEDPKTVNGEGPAADFTLKLATIWPTR